MAVNFLGLAILKRKNLVSLNEEKDRLNKENKNLNDKLTESQKELEEETNGKKLAIDEMDESFKLAESFLKDKKDIESQYAEVKSQYTEIQRILQNAIKNGYRLSIAENTVLAEHFIPPVSNKSLEDKICYGSNHHYPNGSEKMLKRIASCPYVSLVKRGITKKGLNRNHLAKIKDQNEYKLELSYTDTSLGVKMEIFTTAKNEAQFNFIYYLLNLELGFTKS